MKKLFSIITLTFLSQLAISAGIIGEWTVYPAFSNITEVETAGNCTYVLASGGLYCYNSNDQSVTVFDKAKTLSDCEIDHIAWCQAAKRLVIVYSNHNIDLLENNENVINISDYYSKLMTADKSVNGINVDGKYAYLSTGFGIVKINVAEGYICDTYNIGISVNWTHLDSQRIYAESKSNGQYSALLTNNLVDKANWTRTANYTAENKKITDEQMQIAKTYRPNSPEINYFGNTCIHENILYSIPGHNDTNNRMAYIQMFNGDSWTNINNDISYISSRRFRNLYFIKPFPNETNHFYAGGETGLYEYKDGKVITEYWFGNSPLQNPYTLDVSHTNWSIVPTGTFDNEGNFWCFSGIAAKPGIYKLDKTGNMTFFEHKEMTDANGYGFYNPASAFVDSRGRLWFTNNYWVSAALGQYNISTDEMKTYTTFINEDGTEVFESYITCAAEDKDGNIWFGSNTGVLYLAAEDIDETNPEFQQVKVPRNDGTNLADYLLAGIDISCMAIDGGNRKWFGTNGLGVYLIDSDNITQIHHFTSADSPLISDNIESIAIDEKSGEVYFGTSRGLCSYTSDASGTNEELSSNEVYAYPNPVTPDYTGLITITGLTYKANVKITTSSGQLVADGMSNGGTFTWDGCDLDGKRVASGVYMVMVATSEGKKGVVTKIAIVR